MRHATRSAPCSVEDLVRDIIAALGRPVASLQETAGLLGYSVSTVRGFIHRGALVGSRAARNGPIKLTARDIAAWIVESRNRSLPSLTPEAAADRRARLRTRKIR